MESFHEAWELICDYCKRASRTSPIKPGSAGLSRSSWISPRATPFSRCPMNSTARPSTAAIPPLLQDAFAEVFGEGIHICLTVPEESASEPEPEKRRFFRRRRL